MRFLLMQLDKEEHSPIKQVMFNLFFRTPNRDFYKLIQNNQGSVHTLIETTNKEDYDVQIYDYLFKYS